jgi:signal transduction histidine kinase
MHFPKPGPRAAIAAIACAVLLVGAMQYSWFRQTAFAELQDASRSLGASVFQTASREFQRYAPLVADLATLAAREGLSRGEAEAALARDYGLYGPSGTAPRLLASVGLASLAEPSSTSVLSAGGTWAAAPSAFALPLPDEARGLLAQGAILVGEAAPGKGAGRLFLARAGASLVAVIETDEEGFFSTYVEPAVAASLEGASIEWREAQPPVPGAPGRDPDDQRSARRDRGFDPFAALLGLGSGERRTFELPLASAADFYLGHGGLRQLYRAPRGGGGYRPLRLGDGADRPSPAAQPQGFGLKIARVAFPAASARGAADRRLALNFLLGSLLLVGLGASASLAVVQKRRGDLARRKEREFVASITHELRTPITAIRSAADNMRRGLVVGGRVQGYGEMIHAQSLRLGSMIEEVLLFSEVEGRKPRPPELTPIETAAFLAEIAPPLDAIAKSEGIALAWDFGALPERFMGDRESLALIISNLVANALVHAYPGEAKGEVRAIARALLPGRMRVEVEDDGRGVARAEAKLVFEPFYRDSRSRSGHERGSGLGLFIARRKAAILGGDLVLESPYERIDGVRRPGCRFTLELPMGGPDDAA